MHYSGIIIVDLVTQKFLELYTVPQEVRFNPEIKYAALASSGRNNPLYHYTGGEDEISFQIDWFAQKEDLSDVLAHCRWLESIARNDAWAGPPHEVTIIWGDMFNPELTYIVSAAPYKISQFDRLRGMLPKQAYQEVTLKRVVTHNRSHTQIAAGL
jgi:hypothetical protein